jgi:hypothetical protein
MPLQAVEISAVILINREGISDLTWKFRTRRVAVPLGFLRQARVVVECTRYREATEIIVLVENLHPGFSQTVELTGEIARVLIRRVQITVDDIVVTENLQLISDCGLVLRHHVRQLIERREMLRMAKDELQDQVPRLLGQEIVDLPLLFERAATLRGRCVTHSLT